MMGGPPDETRGGARPMSAGQARAPGRRDPEVAIPSSSRRGFNVLVGFQGVQRRLPAVIPPILLSLLLALPQHAAASVVATRQLETNEVLSSVVAQTTSEVVISADSSSETLLLMPASAPGELADEAAPPSATPPQQSLPVISNAAEARRPNVTSRDEGSRRHRPADIRCYCNLPRCVSTGYMCKSASGACFSDLADRSDVELATHGCIELLPSSRRSECRTAGKASSNARPTSASPDAAPCPNKKGIKADSPEPSAAPAVADVSTNQKARVVVLLLCCHSDMCNHIDSPEIRLRLTNDSLFAGAASPVIPQGGPLDGGESAGNPALYFGNGQDGWFRVATIAVPICGAFILMLLIFVAFKILRTDSEDQKLRGQRHKQCRSSGACAWDEEDLCLRHHHCQAEGHLLSPDAPYPEESCHRGACGKGPSGAHIQATGPNPINAKVHLLPQRPQAEVPNAQKKSTKLNYLFLFPRTGKSEKREGGKLQQLPISGATTKAEVPSAVVVVALQGRRDQI